MLYKSKGEAKFTVCPVPLLTVYQLEFAPSLVKLTEYFLEAQGSYVWGKSRPDKYLNMAMFRSNGCK